MTIQREDILFLSASRAITRAVQEVFARIGEEYLLIEAALHDAVRQARSCIEQRGTRVVIATGGTGDLLKQTVDAHVLIMRYRGEDIIEAVQMAEPATRRVAIVGFQNFAHTSHRICSVFPGPVRICEVNTETLQETVRQLVMEGTDTVIGGSLVADLAASLGARGIHIGMDRESIFDALDEARRLVSMLHEKNVRLATINALLDSINDGIIGCDRHGRVSAVNQAALGFLGLSRHEVMGRPLPELAGEDFLQKTLQEGQQSTGNLVHIREAAYAATCVPVCVESGGISGAVLTMQELSRLHMELDVRRKILASGHVARKRFPDIIGSSRAITQAKKRAALYAATDSTVLIYGKTGTGKELFAQSMHNASPRAQGPFVAVNCGALPENLLESELFGYVHGAFTGARAGGKTGLFEMAQGGTIFLDEISEMPLALQSRLLRVCQEREIARIGDDKVIPVDVRVICAANRNLMDLVQAGSFREDLYYRLAVLILELPPLAERLDDLDRIAAHILSHKARQMHRSFAPLPKESLTWLQSFTWPGNVRQLSNVLERAMILTPGRVITPDVLKDSFHACTPFASGRPDAAQGQDEAHRPPCPACAAGRKDTVPCSGVAIGKGAEHELPSREHADLRLMEETLAACRGNRSEAARRLGISRQTLWRHLKGKEAGKTSAKTSAKTSETKTG